MATVIKIKNIEEGYQSIITNGKHTIIGDEPIASKGTDLGLAPSELVLSGLAMCKVGTVRFIARKNNWDIGNVTAELWQEVARGEGGLKTTIQIKMYNALILLQITVWVLPKAGIFLHRTSIEIPQFKYYRKVD